MRRADGRRTWTWAWTFAWVFAGAFLFAGNAGAQAPACLSGTELATLYSAEELVLEARLERGRLSLDGGLLAYRHAGRVYLPLVDVHLHLELPTPSPAAITAIGCTVPVEDAYAEAGALGGLLAAVLDLDASAMRLAIRSSQWFPIEQRRQRERSWQALARRRPLGNPDAPFQPSPHALIEKHSGTLSLFTVGQPSRGTSGEYTLQGAGDLLGMSSRYVVSGDREQAVRNGSGLLERYDASARLLGALGARSVQIGDVSGISDVLLTSGVSGRGVAVGNQARGSRGGFGQTVIAGLLPDGWSVELLRGGELVAVQTEAINGRYEFLDVELEYGGNEFILNFFGPAGERRTEVISESVGSGLARAGEWQYQAVARQSGTGLNGRSRGNVSGLRDDGDWLQTRGRYGWRRWLTQDFGADLFRAQDGGPTSTFASTGFTARLGRWQAQGRGLSELRQGRTAFDAALSGQVSGGSLFARHIDFAGIDNERTRLGGAGLLLRGSQLRWTQSLDALGDGVIASLALAQSERDSGLRVREMRARTTVPLGGWFISSEGRAAQFSGPVSLLNSDHLLRVRRQIGGFGLRLDVRNRLRPEQRLESAQINLLHRTSRRLRLRAAGSYLADSDVAEYSVGGSYLGGQFSAGADLAHRDGDGWRVGANLSLSFSASPDGGWRLHRESLTGLGRISVQAFEDLDADGAYDADEPLIDGFRPTARRGRPVDDRVTLAADQPATVRVHAPRELAPFMHPVSEEFNVLPRAGHHQTLLVPLRQTAEAEGAVYREVPGSAPRPVAGIRVQALDAGGTLLAETRTAHDGIFVIDRLPLGNVRLVIPAEDLSRLAMQATAREVTLREPGDVAVTGSWLLRPVGSSGAVAAPGPPPAPPPATRHWQLALAGFTSPTAADAALLEYRDLLGTLPLSVVPAPQHGLFWVAAGPFDDRTQAEKAKLLARQRLSLDGFWLAQPDAAANPP